MLEIIPMTEEHIEGVLAVEEACFPIPWTRADFRREVCENAMAHYRVALWEGKIVGFGGLWHVVNEGQVTNIAVLEEYRGKHIGDAIVASLIELADELEMIGVTLEVRIGNAPAQKLYVKHGFKPEGIRKKYYSETGEDAVIMWKYFPRYYEEQE